MPTDLPSALPLLQLDNPVIVVDVESTGLDVWTDYPVEVAWYNLATGERGEFIPQHNRHATLRHAHPGALKANGYRDRIFADAEFLMDRTSDEAAKLYAQFVDSPGRPYLAGVNAASFDQFMIAKLWPGMPFAERPWRYRVIDLANMGMQELPIDYLPGLSALVDLLELDIPKPDHTAMGDVYTTTLVLVELIRRRDARLGIVRDDLGGRMDPVEQCATLQS
jgi:DNA polymerase III epsilon subunit-like protein